MTPDRYAHDFRSPGGRGNPPPRCEHCGMVAPDDGTESECPVLLRAEVERLTEALRVATANPSMPSNGCEPTE